MKYMKNTILGVPALFAAPTEKYAETVLAFLGESQQVAPGLNWVVFINPTPSDLLLRTIQTVIDHGYHVVLRCNKVPVGSEAKTAEGQALCAAASEIQKILGAQARIDTDTRTSWAADLVERGEFAANVLAVIAPPEVSALITALRSLGVEYAPVDGGPGKFKEATYVNSCASSAMDCNVPLTELLWRGMWSLPKLDPAAPEHYNGAVSKLFQQWTLAVLGFRAAKLWLLQRKPRTTTPYPVSEIHFVKSLISQAAPVAPGVLLFESGLQNIAWLNLLLVTNAPLGFDIAVCTVPQRQGDGRDYLLTVTAEARPRLNPKHVLANGDRSLPYKVSGAEWPEMLRKLWEGVPHH
jgi:hypothetical protein